MNLMADKQAIQELKMPGAMVDALLDFGHIPLWLRGSIEAPENADQKITLQRGLRPIHPSIKERALRGVLAPESTSSIACGQVAQN
jgi:hypothetical protein